MLLNPRASGIAAEIQARWSTSPVSPNVDPSISVRFVLQATPVTLEINVQRCVRTTVHPSWEP